MTEIEIYRKKIIELLKYSKEKNDENFLEFKNYVQENQIQLKDLNNKDFDILIFAIDKNVSSAIVEYIIQYGKYETLNYSFELTPTYKNYFRYYPPVNYQVPLYCAIFMNNYEVADLLIRNKANINYAVQRGHRQLNITHYFYDICRIIYPYAFKYIIKKGFNVRTIDKNIIYHIIKDRYDNILLEWIFEYSSLDIWFVLIFLSIYRNGLSLTDEQIKKIARDERGKIKIDEKMYHFALQYKNFEALEILLKFDCDEPALLHQKIQHFDLLNIALKREIFGLLQEILNFELLSFNKENLIPIFNLAKHHNEIRIIIELLIVRLFKKSAWRISSSSCETLFLTASQSENKSIMKLLLNLLFNLPWDSHHHLKSLINQLYRLKFYIEHLVNETLMTDDNDNDNGNENENNYDNKKEEGEEEGKEANNNNTVENKNENEYLEKKIQSSSDFNLNTTFIKNLKPSYQSLILNLAIKTKNYKIIKYLLENSVIDKEENEPGKNCFKLDINQCDRNNDFPILVAYNIIENNYSLNSEIFEYLLNHGANVIINDTNYSHAPFSLLQLALHHKKYRVIYRLLNHSKILENLNLISNKNINIDKNMNEIQNNDLFFNQFYSDYLFQHPSNNENINYFRGIDISFINKLDNFGYSVLHYAIFKEDILGIKILIDQGANVNFFKNDNDYGHSALDISLNIGNKKIFMILLERQTLEINKENDSGEIPLLSLIKCPYFSNDDKLEMIECLFKKGSLLDVMDNDQYRYAFVYAIQTSFLPIVELFIRYGVNIECTNIYSSQTPLGYAIEENSLPIVKLLLDHGADPNYVDSFDYSLLTYAIQKKSLPIVKCLVDYGADINFLLRDEELSLFKCNHANDEDEIENDEEDTNKKRKSLLIFAMEIGELSIVQFLCEHHINFDFKNENAINRILDILHKNGKKEIFKYLMDHQIKIEDITSMTVSSIVWKKDLDLLKILVDHGLNIEMKDDNGFTPLFNAIYIKDQDIISYLLNLKADIHSINHHFHFLKKMIINSELDIIKLLIEYNLDINTKDKDGKSLLDYAIHAKNIEFIEYLLDLGIDYHYLQGNNSIIHYLNKIKDLPIYLEKNEKLKNFYNFVNKPL